MNKIILLITGTIFICISGFTQEAHIISTYKATHSLSSDIIFKDVTFKPQDIIFDETDTGFCGYYLRIDKTMELLKISRFLAHEIQNQMRDSLEHLSGSFSTITQKSYLADALVDAIDSVINRNQRESFFADLQFKKGDFLIVLDMDETLLTQWYKYGIGVGDKRIADITLTMRDVVPEYIDYESRNSKEVPELLFSPNSIKLRPGIKEFFKNISKLSGFKGFVLFTAKEDRAAWNLFNLWKAKDPDIFKKVIGFFTRNHLKFDGNLKKASKDLRIFDPSLNHVFIIDDNESRVIQPDLGYEIPAFSADAYIESLNKREREWVKTLHENILAYVSKILTECVNTSKKNRLKSPTGCFSERLGVLHKEKNGELAAYVDFLSKKYPTLKLSLDTIIEQKIFEQPFDITIARPLSEKYPLFKNGVLVK